MNDAVKAKNLLYLTIALIFFRYCYIFYVGVTGNIFRIIPTIIFCFSFGTAILAIIIYDRLSNGLGLRRMMRYIEFFCAYLIILFMLGLWSDHVFRNILDDLFIYSFILLFMILGQFDAAWDDLERILWIPCLLMTIFCIIGLKYEAFSLAVDYSSEYAKTDGDRWAVMTLGYQNSDSMGLWPIVFALGVLKKRISLSTFIALLLFFAFMFLQVWFQKRAPSIRGVVYLLSVLYMVRKMQIGSVWIIAPMLLFVGGIILYELSNTLNFSLLIERFQSEEDLTKIGGRTAEIEAMLSGYGLLDWLIGRGLGGYYLIDNWSAGIQKVTNSGITGRAYMHLGFFLPLLKGGLIFSFIYYWFSFKLLLPKSRLWWMNRFNLVAVAILPVYIIFLFAEGPPTMANLLDGVLFGLLCGRFINLKQPISFPIRNLKQQVISPRQVNI